MQQPREQQSFGGLLRWYRTNAGLTQEQLAKRAGLSRRGIADLERGARRAPYAHTVRQLATALGLPGAESASLLEAARHQAARPVLRVIVATGKDASAATQPRHNLRAQLTSFVGRQTDRAQVASLLQSSSLVTLVGSGGVGKTRLALEVAADQVERWPDGVWLVELGPVVDPALVAQRVATVLGVRETAERSLTSALQYALRDRHNLLVLDNCEHLLDACAHLVDALLRACPGVHVLATSREPFGIGGEVAWRVPSLEVPDADAAAAPERLVRTPSVQLFVERAQAAQPRFVLTVRNAPAVAQICRRLDGIPLALELAAARLEALTAEQVARRLDRRFGLLTGGSRVALPRQQTLAAALDWSYDLLSIPERQLLERLAVFAGGWTLEAAEAICADEALLSEDVLDLLARLTRKSLVVAEETADGAERYSLLESVRDYARQKLADSEATSLRQLRDRHAEFYMALIEQLLPDAFGRTPEPGMVDVLLRRVDSEYDNLRLVLAWLLESDRPSAGIRLVSRLNLFWMGRGLDAEAHARLTEFLERADRVGGLPLMDRATAVMLLAIYAVRQGDYAEAARRHDESVAMWRELGDDLPLAMTLGARGLTAWVLGSATEAVEYLEESRRVFERCARDPVIIAYSTSVLRNLGMVARSRGDYVRATAYFRESVAQAGLGSSTGGYNEGRGLSHLGRTLFLQGEAADAKQVFGEALDIMQQERLAGHTLADCLEWLAALVDTEGRPWQAAVLFGAAAAQWQASGAVRYPPEQAAYAAELAHARAQLRPEEFAAAWAEGHAMSRQQAVAFALEQVRAGDVPLA